MTDAATRPWPFPPGTLRRFAAALAPGSRVTNLRRLRGGLDAAMHALDLVSPSGERQRLVLRRYAANLPPDHSSLPIRGWKTLRALARLDFPAPRPVWFDDGGALFGGPALALTRLPGRSDLQPRDHTAWLRDLAGTLAALHRSPLVGLDLRFLPGLEQTLDRAFERIAASGPRWLTHPDGTSVAAALKRGRPYLKRVTPVLAHGDYWCGNTLWRYGRLCGVVDWDHAHRLPPGFDVGYCRLDLALLDGLAAADAFLGAYERAMGQLVRDITFWDLLAAARALPDPAVWLPGYQELGRGEVTAAQMRERLRAFIARGLQQMEAAG